MDDAGLSALMTPGGWTLLEALPPYDASTAIALGQRLRDDGLDPTLVAAAMTQSRLRAAGRTKFGPFADGMLFTPDGLEQATRLEVAARHAHRFAAAGVAVVADLGCGIGGDAMALAGLEREVVAVDHDEMTAAVATVNLRHWSEAVVRCEDVTTTSLDGVGGAYLDPSRRTATGRRVLDPRKASPPLSFVTELAARLPAVGAKVAPGIAHALVPAGAEAQWVSVDGDVVEAGLWFGLLARDGVARSAVVLRDGQAHHADDRDMPSPTVGAVGGYLYEPDGAVIRAGLVGQVVAAVHGRLLDRSIAYVTTDARRDTPLARGYAVDDVLPFGVKSLRTYLRDRGVGRVEIKKRGTAVTPEQLRRQLRLSGDASATLVLTRVAGAQSVLVCHPLT
ncbi:MAG TPA: SAM-dependent methyltransferase [Actinomycetales bacterium]|nr:SAM-dependent methyltransferase [Actinomycetales bacterium]